MLEETRQQPEALARTLRESAPLSRHIGTWRPRLIVLVARGTSDNAAQFGRYLLEITTGIPVCLAAPSALTLYRAQLDYRETLVAGISQSGESTDTNLFLAEARKRGARTIAITNEAESAMARASEYAILVRAGREQSVAATKTYTCQLLAMYLLAVALGGCCDPGALERLPECVARALELDVAAAEAAHSFRGMSRALCVGRGLNFANAQEFGLKLMETSYVVAERFSAADLMHGPIAIVESGFPVFAFAAPGVTWPSMRDAIRRMKDLKAETVIVTHWPEAASEGRTLLLPIVPEGRPGLEDLYTPIPYIVPAQLFAGHLASIKGLDPDRPRSIQKVTRTL